LTDADIMEKLFTQFNRMLEERGIITHKGTIVDATFVDAPRLCAPLGCAVRHSTLG